MKIIEATYPQYLCEHKGCTFYVRAARNGEGALRFDVATRPDSLIKSWDDLTEATQQDSESLYEQLDDAIYNATPEVYDEL